MLELWTVFISLTLHATRGSAITYNYEGIKDEAEENF
jgi:hypothetical protein